MMNIVIDPGHGGDSQSGKSTPYGRPLSSGLYEKDVTLRLARLLASRLPAQTQLTRLGDYNPSLAQRVGSATDYTDVLLSIHVRHDNDPRPGIWVHEQANDSSLTFAGNLLSSFPGAQFARARFGVLSPRDLPDHTAACMLEVALGDAQQQSWMLEQGGLEQVADSVAQSLRMYGGGQKFEQNPETEKKLKRQAKDTKLLTAWEIAKTAGYDYDKNKSRWNWLVGHQDFRTIVLEVRYYHESGAPANTQSFERLEKIRRLTIHWFSKHEMKEEWAEKTARRAQALLEMLDSLSSERERLEILETEEEQRIEPFKKKLEKQIRDNPGAVVKGIINIKNVATSAADVAKDHVVEAATNLRDKLFEWTSSLTGVTSKIIQTFRGFKVAGIAKKQLAIFETMRDRGNTDKIKRIGDYATKKVIRKYRTAIFRAIISVAKLVAKISTPLTGPAGMVAEAAGNLAESIERLLRNLKGIYKAIRGTRGKNRRKNSRHIVEAAAIDSTVAVQLSNLITLQYKKNDLEKIAGPLWDTLCTAPNDPSQLQHSISTSRDFAQNIHALMFPIFASQPT